MGNRLNKTTELVLCALFSALIAVGAFIKIPTPYMPLTLQTFFTLLAGILLGGKSGAASVSVYLALGLAGLPIFTHGGGPAYLFQPTFGYLLGFAAGAYVTGFVANRVPAPSYKRLLCAGFAGLAVIYAVGTVYYYFISRFCLGTSLAVRTLFLYCFLFPLPGDVVSCLAAATVGRRLRRGTKNNMR